MLWIALELPALPLQVVERAGVSPEPLVVASGPAQRPLVECANQAARAAGVKPGQPVAAARALAGGLRVVPRDPQAERDALERLAAWAGQFTPMVAIEASGLVLEVGATLRLFAGHARLTAALRQGVKDFGLQATLGVAPTALAARLFARAEAGGRAVRACPEPAQLRERLADLPVFLLEWPARTLARLADLGVVRLRELLALPPSGLARRFGAEAALDLAKLVGEAADPREPYVPPPRLATRLELPAEVEGVEPLLFPLRRMLVECEGRLRGRGAGVQRLVLTLEHGRRRRTRLALDFASPEREAAFILAIAREKLGRLALSAPVVALALHAEALLAYAPRESTWLPGAREQALEGSRLVERLVARLGPERVFGLALGNDHRPEKLWMRAPAGAKPAAGPGPGRPRPAWLLNRPQRLVARAELPTLQGPLALAAGPERIEAGWWDGEEVRRDYYVATNARGEAFWIFREHREPGSWYLHGIFA